MLSSVKVSAGKNMVRKLKPFMAVEENCRGSDELYDNGYSRKTSGLRVCSSCLDETRLRLWNSLLDYGIVYIDSQQVRKTRLETRDT